MKCLNVNNKAPYSPNNNNILNTVQSNSTQIIYNAKFVNAKGERSDSVVMVK